MKGINVLRVAAILSPFLGISALASPTLIDCSYSFMGAPFSENQVTLGLDEMPGPTVKISFQGQAHTESLTPAERTSDELLHAWISKESSENSIEMVVYRVPQSQGQSKVINHHVPFGQEVWGTCILQ